MNSSLYLILACLAVLALATAVIGVWQHEKTLTVFSFGLGILFGGILLNVVALRHVEQNGTVHSWATLPEWAYSTPLWAGAFLLGCAGSGKLWSSRRNRRKPTMA